MNPVPRLPDSEVTPWSVYLNRRQFLRGAALAASVATTATIYRSLNGAAGQLAATPELAGLVKLPESPPGDEFNGFRANEPLTSERDITHYNNFYEFTTQKEGVAAAAAAAGFQTTGWQIDVSGLVRKPQTFGWDEFQRISPPGATGGRFGPPV